MVKVHGWRAGPVAGSYQQMCVFENFEESWKGHMKLQPWCRNLSIRDGAEEIHEEEFSQIYLYGRDTGTPHVDE